MKKNASTIILIIVFFVGLSLLLYPIVSDYWNSFHQSRTIATYADTVLKLDRKVYDDILSQAVSYNKSLLGRENPYILNQTQLAQYPQMLDVGGTGIMGYIEIPSINCHLPIYHGTSDSVLQVGIGHLDWTALPVGGRSTHCVLSGHRGLPSAKFSPIWTSSAKEIILSFVCWMKFSPMKSIKSALLSRKTPIPCRFKKARIWSRWSPAPPTASIRTASWCAVTAWKTRPLLAAFASRQMPPKLNPCWLPPSSRSR